MQNAQGELEGQQLSRHPSESATAAEVDVSDERQIANPKTTVLHEFIAADLKPHVTWDAGRALV